MRFNFLIAFVFVTPCVFSQVIELTKTQDTTFIKFLEPTDIIIHQTTPIGTIPITNFYFTNEKDFKSYKKKPQYGFNNLYYPQFKNFDFNKYNMLIVNYEYQKSEVAKIDIYGKFKDGKYYMIIEQKMNETILLYNMPIVISRLVILPKDKCKSSPQIMVCSHY